MDGGMLRFGAKGREEGMQFSSQRSILACYNTTQKGISTTQMAFEA